MARSQEALAAAPEDAVDMGLAVDYQPYWAVRAAYARAAGMSEDPAIRRFLPARA